MSARLQYSLLKFFFSSNAQHLQPIKYFPYVTYKRKVLEVHAWLQPFPDLVVESKNICQFLTPLLSSLIVWLAEILCLEKNIHFQFLLFFVIHFNLYNAFFGEYLIPQTDFQPELLYNCLPYTSVFTAPIITYELIVKFLLLCIQIFLWCSLCLVIL